MARYLIEVGHEPNKKACAQAIQTFLKTGTHYMTNAEWGCSDDEHKAWLIVDVENKFEARRILPSAFRLQAKIVALSRFTMEEVDEVLNSHAD